jgi:hypothetical protein
MERLKRLTLGSSNKSNLLDGDDNNTAVVESPHRKRSKSKGKDSKAFQLKDSDEGGKRQQEEANDPPPELEVKGDSEHHKDESKLDEVEKKESTLGKEFAKANIENNQDQENDDDLLNSKDYILPPKEEKKKKGESFDFSEIYKLDKKEDTKKEQKKKDEVQKKENKKKDEEVKNKKKKEQEIRAEKHIESEDKKVDLLDTYDDSVDNFKGNWKLTK